MEDKPTNFSIKCLLGVEKRVIMTDKRHGLNSPLKSNPAKKLKPSGTESLYKENISDLNKIRTKPAKTTYFFQPTNTLAYKSKGNKEILDNTENEVTQKNVLKESDPNAMGSAITPTGQVKTPHKTYENYDKFIQEQQSSDDSFEGVRWRTSPRRVAGKSATGVPSSPLKNSVSPGKFKDLKLSSTLINEQANSVLSKYGAGFHNILSQTPTMNRTHSDISFSESVHKRFTGTQKSPLLTRAKSFGTDAQTSKKTSKLHKFERPKSKSATPKTQASLANSTSLNSWIDRFDKSNPTNMNRPVAIMAPETLIDDAASSTPRTNQVFDNNSYSKPETDSSREVLDGIDFSDDFSDSGLMTSPSKPSELEPKENTGQETSHNDSDDPFSSDDEMVLTAMKTQSKILEDTSQPQPDGNDDSDDPFSEDDLKFTQLEKKEESLLHSISTNNLNTQQRSDIHHAKSFQEDIKRLEKLRVCGTGQNDHIYNTVNNAKLSYSRPDMLRFQIKSLISNKYKIQNRVRNQTILVVVNGNLEELKLIVRGEYLQLDFQIGDVVHLILTDTSHPTLVDDTHNLLIWNPDILVSATTVSQQMSCPRKSVLVNRLSFPGESSIPLIVGVIIHEIFQACFHSQNWDTKYMMTLMEYEIQNKLLEIYSIGNEVEKVRTEIENQLPYLESWFKTYYRKSLSPNTSIPTNHGNQKVMFAANKALDIEENIWSPTFGLKGKVDVTIEGQFMGKHTKGNFLLPMEIKTGKEYISHHAQSSLYSLLFKDRYDMNVNMFLLVYTKERLTKKYDISPTDLKSLVNLRNRITKYFKSGTRDLPEVIKQSQCDRCEVQQACMTINKLVEDGTPETSGLPKGVYESLTHHLEHDESAKMFYNYWDNLITQEEGIMTSLKKDLWSLTAKEREITTGKAVSDLIIKESDDNDDLQNEFFYTFERRDSPRSLQNSQLTKYDRIIISDQEGHFAIAQGFIVAIRPSFIKVSVKRRIIDSNLKMDDFDEANNQTFQSVLHKNVNSQKQNKLYRIDKDDMFHGMGLARFNILNLFLKDGDSRRKELIVDLKEPKYHKSNSNCNDFESFNSDQIRAFNKILNTEDYSLILGMPGTGKTTVIAQIIKFLVEHKKTVLLASYTHSAVDNILLKIKGYGIDILRIGSPLKVHRDIRKYVPGFDENKSIKDYDSFIKTYMTPSVVATTCLGIGDIAFNLRSCFDYCIIDEASQVSLPISLGPLRFCEKFVLVGDHNQLPPLVQHPSTSVKQGLSRSLFKLLSDTYPLSVAELTFQYRMCEEIMLLSNVLIYNGRLKCGSENVAKQSLYVPAPEKIDHHISKQYSSKLKESDLWIHRILKPENKVIFVNHDEVPGYERTIGEKVENLVEVNLIKQIVESLTLCGVEESNIGVMSLYRSQLRLLHRGLLHKSDVEVLTADQFQGRDKDCIIISLVRSNNENKVGDLLKEWRRVNVAITRSKSKLIILGSKSTLNSMKMLEAFIGLIESRGWMLELPPHADKFYEFLLDETSTETIGQKSKVNQLSQNSKIINKNPIMREIIQEMTN